MKYKLILLLIFFFSFYTSCSSQPADILPEDPSVDFKIGQMLKAGFRGLTIEESTHIVRDLEEYYLGAVVLFDYDVPTRSPVRNIQSANQLSDLVAGLKEYATAPLLITIDQEGGRVSRLKPDYGFPQSVSAQYLGNIDNEDSTTTLSDITAQMLKDLGINTNLAPVVDVNLNSENPIIGDIERSFSADPEIVTKHARLFIKSHHKHGILTTLKHFPGHGSSETDSHLGLVDVTDVWSDDELIPYRNLIESGDVDIIMTAHIFNENWDPEYPATLSRHVIDGILRDQLGFDGVVVSDDMQMDAVRSYYGLETAIKKAINAGVDILSFANNSIYDKDIIPTAHGIIKKLVDEGWISEERIDESYQRIKKLKKRILESDN